MMKIETATIREQVKLTGAYNVLLLDAPEIAALVSPGQFVHIKVPRLEGRVLRRPFSIYKAEDGCLGILYKRVGRGTAVMSLLEPGDEMSVMGPLGNGFPLNDNEHPVLIAGGFGVAPLFLLAKNLKKKGDIFIGGRSSDDILCVHDFDDFGWNVHLATEDGSRGERGLVTDILNPWLKETGVEPVYYACGPDGMLKAIGHIAQETGKKAWLSLDKHMGCGAGACLACVQKLRRPDGSEEWGRVCKDGPIFESREIVWS